jgi:surface antigen
MQSWLLGSVLLLGGALLTVNADAARADTHRHPVPKLSPSLNIHPISTRVTVGSDVRVSQSMHMTAKRGPSRSYGISCVPYARAESGIQVAGNAWQWWDNAQGLYARGDQPEAGSVLNFRANGRMHLGHVAVVSHVVNAREVIVDHANWQSGGGRGGVSRDVVVVDVSEANNWSAVRVELGRNGTFGSVYPTYGFIYNRPDTGVVTASVALPAPLPDINPVPFDLRPVAERPWHIVEEVAEAPSARSRSQTILISGTR